MAKSIESRIEEAREFAASQHIEVMHLLDGEERVSGDARTLLLFERTYLQGLADMAVYLDRGTDTIVDLAGIVTQERLGYLTGKIETGILHIHAVGLEVEGEA